MCGFSLCSTFCFPSVTARTASTVRWRKWTRMLVQSPIPVRTVCLLHYCAFDGSKFYRCFMRETFLLSWFCLIWKKGISVLVFCGKAGIFNLCVLFHSDSSVFDQLFPCSLMICSVTGRAREKLFQSAHIIFWYNVTFLVTFDLFSAKTKLIKSLSLNISAKGYLPFSGLYFEMNLKAVPSKGFVTTDKHVCTHSVKLLNSSHLL